MGSKRLQLQFRRIDGLHKLHSGLAELHGEVVFG